MKRTTLSNSIAAFMRCSESAGLFGLSSAEASRQLEIIGKLISMINEKDKHAISKPTPSRRNNPAR